MVTISVPRKRLSPIFRRGFLTSPAMKVILFQASLLKIEPTIAAAIPPTTAAPVIGDTRKPLPGLQLLISNAFVALQAFAQFAFHISALAARKNPKMINPNNESNLAEV